MTNYVPTYTSDDTSPIVIDTGNKTLVQVGSFAAIFGLLVTVALGVLVITWIKKM